MAGCGRNVQGQDTEAPQVITIDNYELDAVCQFTYLGSTITDNLSLDAEIDKRIGSFNSRSSHGSNVDKPQAVSENKDGSLLYGNTLLYMAESTWQRDMD